MKTLKKYGAVFFVGIVSMLFIAGCEDSPTEPPPPDPDATAVVSGTVSLQDGTLIPDADVLAISADFATVSTTTDQDGSYTLVLPIDLQETGATTYTITASKTGFDTKAVTIPLSAGANITLNFTLDGDDELPPPPSGVASNIVVVGVESPSIGVKGGGYSETSKITFEARDSDGIPVDLDNRIEVMFDIAGGPGGGEFLSKSSDSTGANGQVAVTLNSGTVAGTVQILAYAFVEDRTIASSPVKITIHGGLPAQEHFGMEAAMKNFPALEWVNRRLAIVTVVGDKFSNPVRPGTSVYFRTTAGNVQTEAFTDNDGVVTVELISLGKNIIDPEHGPGFGYVTAETWGEEGTLVTDSVLVLLSGAPQISVDPTSFNIPNDQSLTFNFTVADYNGNPMAEGQSISVSLQVPQLPGGQSPPGLALNGDISRTLPDTQNPAFTEYSVTLSVFGGEEEDVVTDMPLGIVFSTDGPNGGAELVIQGTVNISE